MGVRDGFGEERRLLAIDRHRELPCFSEEQVADPEVPVSFPVLTKRAINPAISKVVFFFPASYAVIYSGVLVRYGLRSMQGASH